MKARLLTLVLVTASFTAFSQGKILFGNDSARLFQFGDVLGADVAYAGQPIPESPLPSGMWLRAALYAGTDAASLSLQTAVLLSGADWLAPGRMANKNVILTGVPGGTPAYFKVFWADTLGTLPGTINGNDQPWGELGYHLYLASSELFTAVPGSSLAYPYLGGPAANSTWQLGNIVNGMIPEPSVFALAGLGLSVLRFRRRRQ